MKIEILTLFPEMFVGPLKESIVGRAQRKGLAEIKIHNLRNWATDKRGTVDDRPFGGGVGMIIRVDVVERAIENLKLKIENFRKTKIILLSPGGETFNQKIAQSLSKLDHLILICGHYEGFDERVRRLVDEEISIGDYVLTGGEIPAMAVVDAIVRLIPGVLEKPEATLNESFASNLKFKIKNLKLLLEYPQYTRPADFKGQKVPEVLLSGDHREIEKWRAEKALEITKKNRPDLLK